MWSCRGRKSCGHRRRQRRIRASREYPKTYPQNPRVAPGAKQERFLAVCLEQSRLEMTGLKKSLTFRLCGEALA